MWLAAPTEKFAAIGYNLSLISQDRLDELIPHATLSAAQLIFWAILTRRRQ
jgi:hypothetical protein